MVGKSVKLSSKDNTSNLVARKLKVCGNKGVFSSRKSAADLAGDLSDIRDAEVAGYLSNREEFILKKRAWELMNPEYQKGKRRKVTTVKKNDPANKTAPGKTATATRTESNAETEITKRPSLEINYDILDKLFDPDKSPKGTKLGKAASAGDQVEYSNQSSEESLLKPQGSEEEEPDWSEGYSNEDAYRGDEECYVVKDFESEDEVEDEVEEEDDGVIW